MPHSGVVVSQQVDDHVIQHSLLKPQPLDVERVQG